MCDEQNIQLALGQGVNVLVVYDILQARQAVASASGYQVRRSRIGYFSSGRVKFAHGNLIT